MTRYQYSIILRSCSIAGFLLAVPTVAQASEELTLFSDHSTVVNLQRRPATVVVGNPSIADVTLDGERLFLHGRGYGSTNVMVLDDKGHMIGDYEVNVTLQEANSATVFKSGARQTYNCIADCQPVLTVGDQHKPHFDDLSADIQAKANVALSQKSGEQPSIPVAIPPPITQ